MSKNTKTVEVEIPVPSTDQFITNSYFSTYDDEYIGDKDRHWYVKQLGNNIRLNRIVYYKEKDKNHEYNDRPTPVKTVESIQFRNERGVWEDLSINTDKHWVM